MTISNPSEAFQRAVDGLQPFLGKGVTITIDGEMACVNGNLDLSGKKPAPKLPRLLKVNGNCYFDNMGLQDDDMPEALFVENSLSLAENPDLTRSPKRGSVGADFNIYETGISQIYDAFVLDDSMGSAGFLPDGDVVRTAENMRKALRAPQMG